MDGDVLGISDGTVLEGNGLGIVEGGSDVNDRDELGISDVASDGNALGAIEG